MQEKDQEEYLAINNSGYFWEKSRGGVSSVERLRLSGMILGNFRLICYLLILYKENIHRLSCQIKNVFKNQRKGSIITNGILTTNSLSALTILLPATSW